MKSFRLVLASASIVALGAAQMVMAAGSTTSTLNVTATVEGSCIIKSVSAVDFAKTYSPLNTADTYSDGAITISCVKGTHPMITLDDGKNNAGVAGVRKLLNASTSEALTYELFKPASGTTCNHTETARWGSDVAGAFDAGVSGGIADATFGICGKIAAGQDVQSGTFSDQVTATVSF